MSLGEFIPSSNTKLLLHLNGSSADSSGLGNSGTDTAITYSLANGKFGQGAGFNGSSSKILYDNSTSLTIAGSGSSITLSCWIKIDNSSTNYGRLIIKGYEGTNHMNYNLAAIYNASGFFLEYREVGAAGRSHRTAYGSLSTNVWTHCLATCSYGDSVPIIYINSVPQALTATDTASSTYKLPTNTDKLGIGASSNSTYFFYGSIDEVILENIAWSAEKIKKYYTMTKGRFGIT